MRGTLVERAMAQKASRPSKTLSVSVNTVYKTVKTGTMASQALTHCCDNLRLQAKLILESASNIRNAAFAVSGNIWNFTDVVEHVAADKEENSNHATGRPNVSVLNNGEDVGRC